MVQQLTNEIILEVIDKGLSAIGNNAKQALWYCLEKDFKFNQNAVPDNFGMFEEKLKGIFGLGYGFLDALFRKYLSEATGEDIQECKTFGESISCLRNKWEQSANRS